MWLLSQLVTCHELKSCIWLLAAVLDNDAVEGWKNTEYGQNLATACFCILSFIGRQQCPFISYCLWLLLCYCS